MDAPTQSSDARAELVRLRRRAYGPNADIADDPGAVARLAQLETSIKAEPRSATDGATIAPVGRGAGDPSTGSGTGSVSRPVEPTSALPVAASTRRRRLGVGLVVALCAALLGAGAATGIAALAAPRPDATLGAVDLDPESDSATDGGWPASVLVARSELRAFEEYRGFRAWAGAASDGLVCLFVTHPDIGLVQQSCTAPSIAPIADFAVGNGTVSLGGGPRGIVRFELRGDEVHVFDRYVPGDAVGSR